MTESELRSLQTQCDELISRQHTLLLASISVQEKADISYAPYVRYNGNFYVFISDLARHTQNLRAHPHAPILFIEPEASAVNPFARKRLTLDCSVREVVKAELEYEGALGVMQARFGEIVAVLKDLPDFNLFCFQPIGGQFVAGFGKAFVVDTMGHLESSLPPGLRGAEDKDVKT